MTKTTHEVVNSSGYPFQLRIEQLVKGTFKEHGWKVLVREHRWVNDETNDDGYIDLVLEKEKENTTLIVECKRIIGKWTFLLPEKENEDTYEATILQSKFSKDGIFCDKINIKPISKKASFCILETEGSKDNRTLEKISGELLMSLENFMPEHLNQKILFLSKIMPNSPMVNSMQVRYLPIIVTTATLQTLSFNPSNIDLKTGKISDEKSTISEVDHIRFQKNLDTLIPQKEDYLYESFETLNRSNDRTVFIVQAESLVKFLSEL